MTSQPRQTPGTRHRGVPEGGQFAPKTAPDIIGDDVGFNAAVVGPPNDWTTRTIELWGTTTFTRTTETDKTGNQVATVTVDCDDLPMLLLAKKGDADYWTGAKWAANDGHRRMWSADITRQMLEEGYVATGYNNDTSGIRTAMLRAGSFDRNEHRRTDGGCHVLTGAVAQLRGLRLIQSMTPSTGWDTMFGGNWLTNQLPMFRDCFDETLRVYRVLAQPPWTDTEPWGPQPVAGHATTSEGDDVFVGEHADLLWRALTETDYYGLSPLKAGGSVSTDAAAADLIAGAVLYDQTAATQLTHGLFDGQLTHGLFDGVDLDSCAGMRLNVLSVFAEALNPESGECRWTAEQQQRLRSFVGIVEALNP